MAADELVTIGLEPAPAVRVQAVLGRLAQAAGNLRPALSEIGAYLESETVGHFVASRAPDGTPWAPLAPATLWGRVGGFSGRHFFARRWQLRAATVRRMANARPLVDHGHLRDSITYVVEDASVLVGSNMIYARIHQFGGSAGRVDHRVQIPARPYLGTAPRDEAEILAIAARHLEAAA